MSSFWSGYLNDFGVYVTRSSFRRRIPAAAGTRRETFAEQHDASDDTGQYLSRDQFRRRGSVLGPNQEYIGGDAGGQDDQDRLHGRFVAAGHRDEAAGDDRGDDT